MTAQLHLPITLNERHMLDLLRCRYSQTYPGNGPRYVLAEHVRSEAGWATRTADLIVQDVWNSGGLALHGHEIKCSRSDWLTELRDPSKAEAFRPFTDYWWLVVSDASIVRDGELPEGWGLLVLRGSRLVAARPAPRLTPEPMPRSMLAPLLRAVAYTAARHAVAASGGESRALR